VADKHREEAEAWTTERELLATAVELLHALYSVTVKVNSKTNPRIEPLHVPRPWDEEKKSTPSMSFGAFARELRA
jgi:hypothetical protein